MVICKMGLVIVGLFPRATRNKRWLITKIDYLTKWVKVEPPTLEIKMQRNLSRKTLSLDLEFLTH